MHPSQRQYWKQIRIGTLTLRTGCYVALKTRPRVIGCIVSMCRDLATSDSCSGVFVQVEEWNANPTAKSSATTYPISRIQQVLSNSEYQAEQGVHTTALCTPSALCIPDVLRTMAP